MKINFKKPLTKKDTLEVSGNPVNIVEEIHNEFLTAGDILLKNANDILNSTSIPNEEKVNQLERFGFNSTDQVEKYNEIKAKINKQKQIAEAVSYYKIKYPDYKYITNDIVDKICQKYKLVLGKVTQYKGFVPQKNINDINKFFDLYPNEEMCWIRKDNYSGYERIITEEEYNFYKEIQNKKTCNTGILSLDSYRVRHEKVKLSICAPLKDMDTKGMMVRNNRLIEVPDPIVLLPKNHANGIDGYLILTAWGDEASDELVINQQNN